DPFGSNHYREIMRMTANMLPRLKLGLHTNAVLLDARAWDDCRLDGRVGTVQISIDASTSETYAYVRRGGDWPRLMRNLEFLADKHRRRKFGRFDLLFVVQTCNFREMADFVRLGQRLGVDSVQFSPIDHWGRGMSAKEYRQKKIWDAKHPQHGEFLNLLRDPIFRDPIVQFSALDMLLANRQPDEAVVDGTKISIVYRARRAAARLLHVLSVSWRQSLIGFRGRGSRRFLTFR